MTDGWHGHLDIRLWQIESEAQIGEPAAATGLSVPSWSGLGAFPLGVRDLRKIKSSCRHIVMDFALSHRS